MGDRLIVDLRADRHVTVTPWRAGDDVPGGAAGQPHPLEWPVGDDDLESLRWYLEDYLLAPYAVYEERGAEVEAKVAGWGEAAFAALFGGGAARDAYVELRKGGAVELVVRSEAPELLGLPWELLRDPALSEPLALALPAFGRSVPTAELGTAAFVEGDPDVLRVLMVISRPRGADDVGYRMVARELIGRLEAVRGRVEVELLRPPTFEQLGRVLAAAAAEGRPFEVVHFDGHGFMGAPRAAGGLADRAVLAGRGEGVLVFERPEGGEDAVPAARVAEVLTEGRVPLVVLNACQSGAVGRDLEAAIATRLLRGGVSSVVAMAYSVYAVAAAEFMAAFYERLFAGEPVSRAVRAGRRRLFERPERPSPKGRLPLADWLVPVHYARRDVAFPRLRTERPQSRSIDAELDALRRDGGAAGEGELAPAEAFVGRDGLFYELEVAARLERVVVLHGSAGTGKTELAKAFGRWSRDTRGVDRPEWVIWHSFEPGVATFGLDGVLADLGLRVFGAEFAQLEDDARRDAVERLLRERRLLLVWDNFESVCSMPDPTGATPPLDEEARGELRDFLARVAGSGRSAVIVTSRTREEWLGDVRRVEVGGLEGDEITDYADQLLAPYPRARPRRARRAFAELLDWLAGHPLSMRLILPHLDTRDPDRLLAALQGAGELPAIPGEHGRTRSLDASIAYSYDHLGADARRLLVAASLFHGVADIDVLTVFSDVDGVPERFHGVAKGAWKAALDEAAGVGLLTDIGAGMHSMHPALPAYLAARWRDEVGDAYDSERAAAERAFLTAYGGFGVWLRQQVAGGDAALAFAVIDRQRRTLGHVLGNALDGGLWNEAQAIVEPLNDYFNHRGLDIEAGAWVDRGRSRLEGSDGEAPSLDTPAGALWLFLVGSQAARDVLSRRLDSAEQTYLEIRATLEAQAASERTRSRLGVTYNQLGMIAQYRGELDAAERWYKQSLAIKDQLGNRPGIAISYHQLGIVAQQRGDLDSAERRYTQSLAINEELGDRPGIASTYHQLGRVAERRGQLDTAEHWYKRSLAIEEDLGNRAGIAISYLQLGIVAQRRGDLDTAERWYKQSLAIREQLGDQLGIATTYHQLGIVAQERGHLDTAERWYKQSLAIKEQLGTRPDIAITCGQLGLLAEQRNNHSDALAWTVRCVALFDDIPHPATGTGPKHLARLTTRLGLPALEACWREVTGSNLPDAVRAFVTQPPEQRGEA